MEISTVFQSNLAIYPFQSFNWLQSNMTDRRIWSKKKSLYENIKSFEKVGFISLKATQLCKRFASSKLLRYLRFFFQFIEWC